MPVLFSGLAEKSLERNKHSGHNPRQYGTYVLLQNGCTFYMLCPFAKKLLLIVSSTLQQVKGPTAVLWNGRFCGLVEISVCLRKLVVLLHLVMATALIVPLNVLNYATWKVHCQMALIRDWVWGIVNETEQAPITDALCW